MCAQAIHVELDVQGRCVVPQNMLDSAGIEELLVIIGAGDHFEMWSRSKWDKYQKDLKDKR
jgi:MraZ protein